MKKLFVHLSLLCLLAALAVPMIGCHKDEAEVEESTTTTVDEPVATPTDMGTDMGTTSDMGTDMGTTDAMGTEMTPPAGQ
jgi:hypothetical protein